MFALMFEPANLPFAVALILMLGIGLLEGLATLMGAGVSSFFDKLSNGHADGLGHDAGQGAGHHDGIEGDAHGLFGKMLDWVHIGRVPLLVVLVVFLLCFGLVGLLMQGAVSAFTGKMLPGWLAACVTFVAVLPLVRGLAGLVGRVMPKDETSVVSRDSFVGRIAVITTGTAELGQPAPAKLKDEHGQAHYVLVEPDSSDESFATGSEVILISHTGAVFRAIRNTHPRLVGTG